MDRITEENNDQCLGLECIVASPVVRRPSIAVRLAVSRASIALMLALELASRSRIFAPWLTTGMFSQTGSSWTSLAFKVDMSGNSFAMA